MGSCTDLTAIRERGATADRKVPISIISNGGSCAQHPPGIVRRNIMVRSIARPTVGPTHRIGMSEAAGSVKGCLPKGVLGFVCAGGPVSRGWSNVGRDEVVLVGGRGLGRAVKAGRRPPGGEALRARSMSPGYLWCKPVRACWSPRPSWSAGGRAALSSPGPHGLWSASRPCSAAWSCLRRAPTWSGPSMERYGAASSAQSHTTTRVWGHADLRAGLLAASEHHPVLACARQRISPSRRP